MKKYLTIDSLMAAFVSAIGFGFGYSIPSHVGLPEAVCLASCLIVGVIAFIYAEKTMFSEAVQKNPGRRMLAFAAFAACFFIAEVISLVFLNESLLGELKFKIGLTVALAALGFIASLVRRYFALKKIYSKYGGQSDSFVFDAEEKATIEYLNEANKEIFGDYDEDLAVTTKNGIFVGREEGDVRMFNGIPFAQPPVGALRWKAPVAPKPTQRVFEAFYPGPSAPQADYEGNPLRTHRQSEDCLYLNIATNAKPLDGPRHVIVYFHGGDFSCGGAVDPSGYGLNLAANRTDTVFVNFNYRLGLLGFIDFSDFPDADEYCDSANLGCLDQIAALSWVKDNIAAFGGNPHDITVMGDGAGATSIALLAASPKAQGLFQKAVLYPVCPDFSDVAGSGFSKKAAQSLLRETHLTSLDELAHLSEARMMELARTIKTPYCGPLREGKLFPENIYQAYAEGKAAGVDFIFGITQNAMDAFLSETDTETSEKLIGQASEEFFRQVQAEGNAELFRLLEERETLSDEAFARKQLLELWCETAAALSCARRLSDAGSNVYLLYWDIPALIEGLGTGGNILSAAFLGNAEAAIARGHFFERTVTEVLQALLMKFIEGKTPELYHNEITGVHQISWLPFPEALLVTETDIREGCDEEKAQAAHALLKALQAK